MPQTRALFRAALLAVVVASTVAFACPAYREVLDEPSSAEDPFYWVDYEKRQSYRTRMEFAWGWGLGAGAAVAVPAGIAYYLLLRRRRDGT